MWFKELRGKGKKWNPPAREMLPGHKERDEELGRKFVKTNKALRQGEAADATRRTRLFDLIIDMTPTDAAHRGELLEKFSKRAQDEVAIAEMLVGLQVSVLSVTLALWNQAARR